MGSERDLEFTRRATETAGSHWFLVCGLVFLAVAAAAPFRTRRLPPERDAWSLHRADGCLAELESDPLSPTSARIRIDRLAAPVRHSATSEEGGTKGTVRREWTDPPANRVIAVKRGLATRAGRPYQFRFRGRTSAPREVDLFFSQDRPPSTNLGLSARRPLGTAWREYELSFLATLEEPSGAAHFAVGEALGTIELDGVELIEKKWGVEAPPAATAELLTSADDRTVELACSGPSGTLVRVVGPPVEMTRKGRFGLSFRARSSSGAYIECRVVDGGRRDELVAESRFQLHSDWQEYNFEFLVERPTARGRVDFRLDALSGGFTLKDFVVRSP